MKIVHLAAGAGQMYCGSCLHGNTLAAALRQSGQDVTLVPLYTPLRTDEADESTGRVVFSGINVYLQQKSGLFRYTPRLLDRLLEHAGLLGRVAGITAATQPERLGPLTVSILRGEEGRQRKELDKLLRWLEHDLRADVVHLSNVMLVGLARQITRRLGVPVVCTLSGEDVFLERLGEPHRSEARAVLQRRCEDLAALIALSGYYADFMAQYLSVPRQRIHVILPGLNLTGHGTRRARPGQQERRREDPCTLGYLGRICPEKGLHQLVEALEILLAEPGLPPIRLLAAGYLASGDRSYLAGLERRLARRGLADRFEYVGEVDRAGKIAFLQSLDVMSLPAVHPESKGLSVLEAWANAVPVVLPSHGAFPELIADTGGGLLCRPHDAPALAAALAQLIRDPELASTCGRRAQQAVGDRYHAQQMARRTIALYQSVLGRQPAPSTDTPA